jgi:hypothetical protein
MAQASPPAWAAAGCQPFNISRADALNSPTPPIHVVEHHSHSVTTPTYRLRWNEIHLWRDFDDLVREYWANLVPQIDKGELIFSDAALRLLAQSVATQDTVANENIVVACINAYPIIVHSVAANGLNDANRPSDRHSRFRHWAPGITGPQGEVAGIPDFVMATEATSPPRRITVIVEVKNPWIVTPDIVDEVIDSTISFVLFNGRRSCDRRYTPCRSRSRANLWLYGA